MAKTGPKPKPTALKQLEGNPGQRRLNEREPVPPADRPEPPDFLTADALAEWYRITDILDGMNLLSTADLATLAAYCTVYGRWVDAERKVQQYGAVMLSPNKQHPQKSAYLTVADHALEQLRKLAVEFGLTPSARSRVHVPNAQPADAFEAFLQSGPN